MAKDKGLELFYYPVRENLQLLGDKDKLRQVFINLITNSIKYTEKGEIIIQLTKHFENNTELSVINIKDTGIGIPEEYTNTIFEEFRQASEGWGRKYEGTGLGLTLTKKFVQLMNGSISLKSKVGAGSTFSITFPSLDPTFLKHSNNTISNKDNTILNDNPYSMPTILLVEDDIASQLITKLYLKNHCQIEQVDTGEKAIQKASEKDYNAIFMDINMKGIGGVEAAKKIRDIDNYYNKPIVALTAYAMKGDKEKFLSMGFDYYLSKPFTKEQLLNLFNSIFNS